MTCTKTAYGSGDLARQKARRVAVLNGHDMRAYHCRRCGQWHLTAATDRGDQKVLPWRRLSHGRFVAEFGDGQFQIQQVEGTDTWWALCPNGLEVGPFSGLAKCRQWCDAASFLPEDRWTEVAPSRKTHPSPTRSR